MYPKSYATRYRLIMENCTRTQVWGYAKEASRAGVRSAWSWYDYYLQRIGWDDKRT
jgi:hypothetical protein